MHYFVLSVYMYVPIFYAQAMLESFHLAWKKGWEAEGLGGRRLTSLGQELNSKCRGRPCLVTR